MNSAPSALRFPGLFERPGHLSLWVLALLAGCSSIQPSVVSQPGPRRPALVNEVGCLPSANEYPPEAMRLGKQGTSTIEFEVGVSDNLVKARVAASSGSHDLDAQALRSFSRCKVVSGVREDGSRYGGTFRFEYKWTLGQ